MRVHPRGHQAPAHSCGWTLGCKKVQVRGRREARLACTMQPMLSRLHQGGSGLLQAAPGRVRAAQCTAGTGRRGWRALGRGGTGQPPPAQMPTCTQETWKYHQFNSKAHAEVVLNLTLLHTHVHCLLCRVSTASPAGMASSDIIHITVVLQGNC